MISLPAQLKPVGKEGCYVNKEGLSENKDASYVNKEALSENKEGNYLDKEGLSEDKEATYVSREGLKWTLLAQADSFGNMSQCA